ncbi:glycosyltransferase family 4 protein [Serratia ureilytica]|uniref:glycosyltransferase family 4 protein n=1 Tax=Serratia ureilytica TaxID=300181 RepID=UPI001D186D35|nr:glycosyltransferase family 4 protein [Serratia ureilytica]MCC4106960.1 glycosyltransferase family 4 protein [Serratia ureilytica]
MRIAYICADPGIPVFGSKGASVHVQEILRGLLKRGVDITLYAQRPGGPMPDEFSAITLQPLPDLPSATSAEARARQALENNAALSIKLANAAPYDAIYERYSLWSDAGMAFARRTGIPGILEVNSPLLEEQRIYRELPLEQEAERVLRTVLSDADTVIAVSPGVKSWLSAFTSSTSRIHVVANGVNLARFALPRVSRSQTTIGFLGTLKPWHGLHSLVDAFTLLRARGSYAQLSIIGDGPELPAIRHQLQRQGLLPYVRFSGAVPPDQVPALLAEIDIAVAPYPQLAGFYFSPLKIYEYMAAGLPIITTRVGHLTDVITAEKTGLLVEPDSPPALCAALERLLEDKTLRLTLGAAGRKKAEQEHSWDSVIAKIWHLAGLP